MRRHRTDITSLIAGLMFVTFSVLIVLDRVDEIDLDVRWIPAIVLIGLGLANLLGSLAWRRTDETPFDSSTPPDAPRPVDPESSEPGEPADVS